MQLRPKPGFNPLAVSWGAPDETVATECSLCDAPFGDGEVPLMFMREDGWVAQFCETCAFDWFGIERLA